MPASDNDSSGPACPTLREAFKDAKRSAAARLALKIKLARLSDAECLDILDYIEVMQSLGCRGIRKSPRPRAVFRRVTKSHPSVTKASQPTPVASIVICLQEQRIRQLVRVGAYTYNMGIRTFNAARAS